MVICKNLIHAVAQHYVIRTRCHLSLEKKERKSKYLLNHRESWKVEKRHIFEIDCTDLQYVNPYAWKLKMRICRHLAVSQWSLYESKSAVELAWNGNWISKDWGRVQAGHVCYHPLVTYHEHIMKYRLDDCKLESRWWGETATASDGWNVL